MPADARRRLRDRLAKAAADSGRTAPPLAAWVVAAVDPTDEAIDQLRRALVGYLAAPGYADMFAFAGFGALVDLARSGASAVELFAAIPPELVAAVGCVGDVATCRRRVAAYASAGVDEVVLVPATAGDPGGRRTLTALAPPQA